MEARLAMGSGERPGSDRRSGWGGRFTKLRAGLDGGSAVAGMGLSLLRGGSGFLVLITKGRSVQGEDAEAGVRSVKAPESGNNPVFGSLEGVVCIIRGG